MPIVQTEYPFSRIRLSSQDIVKCDWCLQTTMVGGDGYHILINTLNKKTMCRVCEEGFDILGIKEW